MLKRLNLRNKFLLPTLFLIIGGMGLVTLFSYATAKQAIEVAIKGQIEQTASSTLRSITSWLDDRRLNLQSWSKQEAFLMAMVDPSMYRGSANVNLEMIKQDHSHLKSLSIAGKEGEVVASSEWTSFEGTVDVSGMPFLEKALAGETVVSDPLKSPLSGERVVVLASPMTYRKEIGGVFITEIDHAYLTEKFVQGVHIGKTGYGYLVNGNGKVIAAPEASHVLNLDLAESELGRRILEQKSGFAEGRFQGAEHFVSFAQDPGLGWIFVAAADKEEIFAPARNIRYLNTAIALAVVLAAALLIFLVARSVSRPMQGITDALHDMADHVSDTSTQVLDSSRSLSEEAGQQAASIEETSSSLEEMSSMTHQNADHAVQADQHMKKANRLIEQSNASMEQLRCSMNDISKTSEETKKINKTIDEIAFQTNLLALNAAVEAARAGEAGAGFAVVADEVRNLAMRAAEAARNTAELIEESVRKIAEGSQLVGTTDEVFGQVAESASKVGSLVGEIAAASSEQAEGIRQINAAVSTMDQVTQHTASTAADSSEACLSMNRQALEMKTVVEALMGLINGSRAGRGTPLDGAERPGTAVRPSVTASEEGKDRSARGSGDREIQPDRLLPFGDDDDRP